MIQLISFLLLGLSGGILQYKRQFRFVSFLHLLFFLAVGLLISADMDGVGQNFLFGLMALTSLNFVVSNLLPDRFRRDFIRLIFPFISLVAFFFLCSGETIEIFDTKTQITSKILIAGTAIALLSVDVGGLKIKGFDRLLGGMSDDRIMQTFLIFTVAVSVFLGMFGALSFGIYTIATSYLAASFL